MATPTGFVECNTVLTAPKGQEESCGNLPIVRVPGVFTGSVWELDPDELETVKSTGKIFLAVLAGGVTQPPVVLCAYTPGIPQAVVEAMTNPPEE
jgi:hypothetical protein